MLLTILLIVALMAALVLVAYGTIARNKWGINLDPVACPTCGASGGALRPPRSLNEMLWGGWTCQKCGCVMDKWGRAIPRSDS
jgi:hypothetical protein